MVYMKRQLQLTLSIINYNKRIMNGTTACMSIDSLKLEHWYRSSYLTYIYTDEHKINVKIGRVYKYINNIQILNNCSNVFLNFKFSKLVFRLLDKNICEMCTIYNIMHHKCFLQSYIVHFLKLLPILVYMYQTVSIGNRWFVILWLWSIKAANTYLYQSCSK